MKKKSRVEQKNVSSKSSASGGKGRIQKGRPAPLNFNKAKKVKKGQWNLVPIGEEYFSNKEFENLVSFEELVEYDVVTKEDGTKEILSGVVENNFADVKNMKRKADEDEEESEAQNGDDIPVPKIKKTKRPGRKKANVARSTVEQDDTEVINTSAGLVIVEEDNEIHGENENPMPRLNHEVKRSSGKADHGNKNPRIKSNVKSRITQEDRNKTTGDETVESGPSNDEESDDFDKTEWLKLGVPDVVIEALKEKNFKTPTTIQTLALPAAILGRKDIVGAAETGSGKTLAFAIPIIDGILKLRQNANFADKQQLKALILTPTRELAVQIKNHIDAAAKHSYIKTVVIVGGLASQKQERLLRGRPDIVIATPGRLWELVQEGDEHLSTLNEIRFLAVDETDRMVEKGHFQELEGILTAVNSNEVSKEARQNFVFSATLAFTHEPPQRMKMIGNKKMKSHQPKKLSSKDKLKQIMELVGVRPNPKIVDITTSKGTCETLIEMQLTCSKDHKDYYLYYFILQHPGRTIVFCNSINCVRRLTNLFFLLECGEVLPLHSEMHQKQRLRNLERFTANEKGILIATDVAARGLDIQNIQHVIHYQVPKTAESYIHRSGRTARAFKGGIAILFVEPSETTTVKNIFRSLGREEIPPNFAVDNKAFREIKSTIEMAVKVEQFEHSVRKKLADHNWMEKAKKEMDLATSSDDSDDGGSGTTRQKKSLMQAKKKLDNYKKQLSQMVFNNNKTTSPNDAPQTIN